MKRSLASSAGLVVLAAVALVPAAGARADASRPTFEPSTPRVHNAGIGHVEPRDVPAPARPWFSLFYRPQQVTVAGTDMVAGFSAWVRARRDHSANGYLALRPPDGLTPIRFEPLFATAVPETETGPGYIIILMALKRAPQQIANLAIATVQPDPAVPSCDIWDFTSNVDIRPLPRHIVFHAEGAIRFAHERTGRGVLWEQP